MRMSLPFHQIACVLYLSLEEDMGGKGRGNPLENGVTTPAPANMTLHLFERDPDDRSKTPDLRHSSACPCSHKGFSFLETIE